MPHIEELRRQRAGINEQVQALATIDASGSTLTAEQLTEFANLQQQFTDISAKIERLEAAERAAALVAKPVKATQQGPAVIVKAEPKPDWLCLSPQAQGICRTRQNSLQKS